MLQLDEFESVFRSASKVRYEYEQVPMTSGLLVTGFMKAESEELLEGVRHHLRAVIRRDFPWQIATRDGYYSVDELLDTVRKAAPTIVCTHRNLSGKAGSHPYSLGSYVDVLTQVIAQPVLLVPTPSNTGELPNRATDTSRVMVLTDDLSRDAKLIHYAAQFTAPRGDLFLAHLEDERTFDRYMDIISKVPGVDTQAAHDGIRRQLLKEPEDFISSCRDAFAEAGKELRVHGIVEMGHRARACKQLVDEHDIDLVVMSTKDDEQLAMQGLAYTLSIELRDVSLLLV